MSTESAQKQCDSIAYPPTHTYDVKTLAPTGVLKDRVDAILSVAPDLMRGNSFLDVGCSKGWFSLWASAYCFRVLALDKDPEPLGVLRQIANGDVEVRNCSFGDLETRRVFDRIFVGNCMHYLFVESVGWDFIDKLADLACGHVVIEGPTGMDCKDMEACIPPELQPQFNESLFMAKMLQYFRLEEKQPTVAYTPDRYVMRFRCAGRVDKLMSATPLQYEDYLRHVYTKISAFCRTSDTVVEVGCRHDRGVISQEIVPHVRFLRVDRRAERADKKVNVIHDPTPPCDVVISTAVLHHTPKDKWRRVLENLTKQTRRWVFLTGPHEDVVELFGDHEAHLDPDEIKTIADQIGWEVHTMERIGMSYPLCELFVALKRG